MHGYMGKASSSSNFWFIKIFVIPNCIVQALGVVQASLISQYLEGEKGSSFVAKVILWH